MTTINPTSATIAPGVGNLAMKEDGGFMHFMRFCLIGLAMMCSIPLLFLGVFWVLKALSCTGRRKRDMLLFLVPVVGLIVQTQTIWRYTAKNVYWTPREDRPSKSLFSGS